MNNQNQTEFILATLIIVAQLAVFIYTIIKIRGLYNLIPDVARMTIPKVYIPESRINEFNSSHNLNNLSDFAKPPTLESVYDTISSEINSIDIISAANNAEPVYEISLIGARGQVTKEYAGIANSINIYLIKNKGNSADFNLIKDVVNRNTDSEDEGINLLVSVPLYLGLVGTMFGVIIGLWGMSSLSGTLALDGAGKDLGSNISLLLNGVKVAMIASLIGLLLTIINSALCYKIAKSKLEYNKNKLFDFIQTELLPDINRDLAGTFSSLQSNMAKFNTDFNLSIGKLGDLVKNNHETLRYQASLINDIRTLNLRDLAGLNVEIFDKLSKSIKNIEKFNEQFESINDVVKNSTLLSDKITDVLVRTDDFKDIALAIKSNIEDTSKFIEFVQSHLAAMDDIKRQNISVVVDYGDAITKAVGDLREHIQAKITSIKDITIKEEDLMIKALSENRNNLGKLTYLENLNSELSTLSTNTKSSSQRFENELSKFNQSMNESLAVLKEINRINTERSLVYQVKRMWSKMFVKK